MRINSRGQVTIPAAIRRRLSLGPGCEVDVTVRGDVVEIRRVPHASPGQRITRRLRDAPYDGPSTDELMALTRERPFMDGVSG